MLSPNDFRLSKLDWWWFKGGDSYRRRVGENSFEAEGTASGVAVGLAGGEDLEGLSLSAVSSTLASFFLFLAILRYSGMIPFYSSCSVGPIQVS